MAYNTILQFEYKDINEVDTIVRVKQLDYAGAVTTRDYVSAGAKFAWGDSSNNVPVIYGSQCTVYVDSESDYEFLYLFSSNARKHLVEVTKGGQLFWIGFIEPDSWSEPLVTAPYPVEFTAYDGLGMLDNIDFVDANGDTYTGTMTMIALIQQLLGNIGITLKLNTATDFKEEQQAAGTNYFEVHKVNLEAFEGMTCFEVLEQLLEGHRIQQRNGEWWITSYTLVPAGGSITYRTYANGSDVSSGTVAQSIEDASSWWSEGEMSMNMLPALRNITLEQDYGYQKNILRNGDFSQLDANGKPKYWVSLYAFECYVKPLSSSGDVFLYVPKQAVSIPTMETLATSINNITAGNGNIKFSIDYAVISEAGNIANVFLQISFVASGGTIYYIQKNEETEEWEWVTSGTNYIQLNGFQLTGVSLADVDESFSSFTATLNALPSDGSLVIALMKPNSSYNIDGIGFKDAKIELLLNEDDNYEGSNAITVINNQNNNNVPDNIELVIGVIPQIANNEVIYKGGILRSDGTPATGFAAGTSAFYSWAELIGRVNASMQRNPRRAYEGTFADIIPRMNLVITDANNSNLRLIETGISYDDGMQAIQGQYVEVMSLSLVAGQEADYVVKNAVSTESGSSSSGSGGIGSGTIPAGDYWKKTELVQSGQYLALGGTKISAGYSDNSGLLSGFADTFFWKKNELVQSGNYLLIEATKISAGYADNSELLNGLADTAFWKKAELVQSGGYLFYNSAKTNAGYADNAGLLDGIDSSQFLRRDIAQTVSGTTDWQAQLTALFGFKAGLAGTAYVEMLSELVAMKKNIGSSSYFSGFAGSGWRLDLATNHLTIDELTVRKAMSVYELVINQIRGTNGALWVSDAAKVSAVAGNRMTIDTAGSSSLVPFMVNDVIRCQRWTGSNVKYYVATVTEVGSNYIDVTKTDGTSAFEAGDEIVRIGNTSNASRQGAIYLTASDNNAPYLDVLDGVVSASLTGKTKARLGKLDGITSPVWGALSGYGVYTSRGYFEGVSVSGVINVTGGNAETTIGAQAKATAAQTAAISSAATDATTKANTAQTNAQTYASGLVTNLQNSLGDLAFENLIGLAKLDSTVIQGGYIKSTLLDVNAIRISGSLATTSEAQGYASSAQIAAISASSTDATTKANAAETNAKTSSVSRETYDFNNHYCSAVILLIPYYYSGYPTLGESEIFGQLTFRRGGPGAANRTEKIDISAKTAYNSTYVSCSKIAQSWNWQVVRCLYNGLWWLALQNGSNVQDARWEFWGRRTCAITNGFNASDQLRFIAYRMDGNPGGGNGILNQEVNDSITSVSVTPMTDATGVTIENTTGSQLKATAAQTAAQNYADGLAATINATKQNAIVNGQTLIVGGYLNTVFIQAGSIVANMIAAGTITGAKIAAGTIDATKINATNLHVTAANVDGTLVASQINFNGATGTNVNLTGVITAESGHIGDFSISSGGIVNETGSAFVVCRNSDGSKNAVIGTSAFSGATGLSGVAFFKNSDNRTSNIYALYAVATNSGLGRGIAGRFEGDVEVTGLIEGISSIPSSHVSSLGNSSGYNYMPSGYYLFVGGAKTDNRSYYLPYANAYEAGSIIRIVNWNEYDAYIYPRGSDTINGYSGSSRHITLNNPSNCAWLRSNGSTQWMIIQMYGEF